MKNENYKSEVTCLRIRKKKSMVEPELESSVLMSVLYRVLKKISTVFQMEAMKAIIF